MAGLGWVKVFLFLFLQLHVTVFANIASVLKRVGEEVMLSCQNVRDVQHNCNGTTWLLSGLNAKEIVPLVTYGQIDEGTGSRFTVTPNCSLVLKNITAEDVGRYECQQYKYEGLVNKFVTDLSVINLAEQQENQTITLSCSVLKYGSCKHRVKWLLNQQEIKMKEIKTSAAGCSATVTYPKTFFNKLPSMDQFFQCKVTQTTDQKEQLFSVVYQSSAEDKKQMKTPSGSKTVSADHKGVLFIALAVGLFTVIIIAVAIVGWRVKRKKTLRDENTVNVNAEDVFYSTIRHRENSDEILVHGDLETVTYSTVRNHC